MFGSLLTFPGEVFADLDRLQGEMDRLFGAAGIPASIRATGRGAFPAVNIGTTDETIEVIALAPGIDPATLDLSIDKGLLVISGKRSTGLPKDDDRTTCYLRERFNGDFRRVVSLPEDADPQRVNATYRDGVLCVTVHKHEASKPRRITVN